ncbi:MAG TPA: anti-sigma factor [Rhizobacter sp.]|nr:anti-sigma factor [Rhizobacter sp.]
MNYLLPERLDRLAREYALGTLSGGARRRFERVLAQAPAAGRAVAAWQERFTVLSAGLPPMAPRDAVWSGLEQRLFSPSPRKVSGWWRWLGGALAGVMLCSVVLRLQPGLIGLEPQAEALPASYVGLLTDADGKPTVLASSRRHGRQLTLKLLQPLNVPADRVAQLWALPSDGSPAFPLGVVPAGGPSTLTLSDSSEALFFKVSRLAVSLETAAAQPGDKPTQPFILSGHCVKLW